MSERKSDNLKCLSDGIKKLGDRLFKHKQMVIAIDNELRRRESDAGIKAKHLPRKIPKDGKPIGNIQDLAIKLIRLDDTLDAKIFKCTALWSATGRPTIGKGNGLVPVYEESIEFLGKKIQNIGRTLYILDGRLKSISNRWWVVDKSKMRR